MHAGVLLVDKPGGMTSHDVVSRARRALGTRKIGHAGTLDPMATGLLILGVEGATRLLTYLVGLDKTYLATIRLGVATTTDDAEGEIVDVAEPAAVSGASDELITQGIAALTGEISQVPSSVSAIKVNGRRAYDLARAGEQVELRARAVTVSRFEVLETRRHADAVELDVVVDCSSGTYIRALARDLGNTLGIGGHLTALRRTRIGRFDVSESVTADAIAAEAMLAPAEAAARAVGRIDVTAEEARDLRHGKRLDGAAARLSGAVAAAIDPEGRLVGIVEARGSALKSAMNVSETQGEPA
ncbi:tRNA pseudouridine(55) synthase TruB [Microbacterium sp. Marseille-Q6965]|uniref:tRNA pseudouridine(55) synthase TruB n=1 Tax=Microbacterium sp. Marseille-Q6965 TaxID=2965072 RepID=UPI0021B84B4E|nr:tRNA pseudouridine(55) synthase TruB [Microbacterium sp. Marseille-Q6965]